MLGLYALERLVRVKPDLIDVSNVNEFFNKLIESLKYLHLKPISLRLIAVSLEVVENFNSLDYK